VYPNEQVQMTVGKVAPFVHSAFTSHVLYVALAQASVPGAITDVAIVLKLVDSVLATSGTCAALSRSFCTFVLLFTSAISICAVAITLPDRHTTSLMLNDV